MDYDGLRFADRATRKRFARMESWLLARLRGGLVLDLACGTGRLTERISGTRVVGVDISREMLAMARRRRLVVVRGDGNALPFADAIFDTVICTDSAFALLDPELALRECARVLKPGGLLGVHYPTDRIWTPRRPFGLTSTPGRPALSGADLLRLAERSGYELEASALFRWLRVPPYLVRIATPPALRVWNHAMFVWRRQIRPSSTSISHRFPAA